MKMEKSNSVSALKKQLAAAVAMVCVAAVATSSATYAWFVSNNTVKATVSSISAQSNAAYLTIDKVAAMTSAGTQTSVDLTESPIKLYPSRPHQAEGGTQTDWNANTTPASLVWQTAYAADASKSDVQTGANGKALYYDLTATTGENWVTGTEGYVSTSQVYVSSSQGAFNSLTVENMSVSAAGSGANNDIVNAVGALISCGNEWELWEYVAPTGDETTGTWAKTTQSANTLSGANTATFGDAVKDNKVLTVNITLFYDGDYSTINTQNFDKLGQAKVSLGFTAVPVQQGVDTPYTQGSAANAGN